MKSNQKLKIFKYENDFSILLRVKCFIFIHNENGGMFDQFWLAELSRYLLMTQLWKYHRFVFVYSKGKESELEIMSIFK